MFRSSQSVCYPASKEMMSAIMKNNSGMTLIEVMIAGAILSTMGLYVAQVTIQGQKGQNSVRISNDFNSLTGLLQLAMQKTAVCTPNFLGKTFNTATLPVDTVAVPTLLLNGQPLITVGLPYSAGLTITKIDLEQFQQVTAGTSYLAMLRVEATKTAGSFLGSPLVTSNTPLALSTLTVLNTATIQTCGNAPLSCTTRFAGPNAGKTADALCPAGYVATGGGCWTGSPGNDNVALGAPNINGQFLSNPAGSNTGGAESPAQNLNNPNAWHCWSNDNTVSAYVVCCQ